MNDGTQDQVKVSFPASPTFSRVARVAVAGLALRLGVGVADVERLRLAVDAAVSCLKGDGRITLEAHWEPNQLHLSLYNPDRPLGLVDEDKVRDRLGELVDEVKVVTGAITMTVANPTP